MASFSIVVPTRDRPDLLDFGLAGIASQTHPDVEVIVADNPTSTPAREVFDRWARAGWHYTRPEQPLTMHDNFERGCEQATGDYVAVVFDKTILQPSALAVAHRALQAQPGADIVTWRNEPYYPLDEVQALAPGHYEALEPTAEPAAYDPMDDLRIRFAFAERRGVDYVHFTRGKIVFGLYSRDLLERMRDATGRMFHALTPDYTSMVAASVLARGAVDVGRPLLLSYNSRRGNGHRASTEPSHARGFIEGAKPGVVAALPIPGLYASTHNIVAYDLVASAARLPAGSTPVLDYTNLLRRAREDLELLDWPDAAERAAQYAIIEAEEARLGVVPAGPASPPPEPPARARAVATARALLGRLADRARGRTTYVRPTYASPVDAARAADEHYSAAAR